MECIFCVNGAILYFHKYNEKKENKKMVKEA